MIQIERVSYRVAGRPLLEEATAGLNKGWRIGLVGRNGSGKTTLLNLIAGSLQPDQGEIRLPRGLEPGMLAQEAPAGPQSLIETVLATDRERSALLAEAESAGEPARIAEIHERLAAIEAQSAPARAARILAGLGFDDDAQQGAVDGLSGGWRMRVGLAALLFTAPELLLLDEPSNHLDLEATLWLEGYLAGYPGTLILVSHDRDLLNKVPNKILHLEGHRLTLYNGNYDRFEATRRERQARVAALNARQQAQRRHIQKFVDRFRFKASKARQAQSRIKALARLEPIAGVVEERVPEFRFPAPQPLAPPLLTLEEAAAGYGHSPPVISGLNLRLDMDDRIALLGANGNGKSTLMRLLAGRLEPSRGRIVRSSKLATGYFAQDQAETLDYDATALLHLGRLAPDQPETKLRARLGAVGLSGDKADTRVADLSGGEKARLLLALMSRADPQLLLLDEPTNHLDVDSREALVRALNDFPGAVVLVSHDPHLIELVVDQLWLVAGGRVVPFDGDLDDYRRLLASERRRMRAKDQGEPASPEARTSKKARRRNAAQARQAVAHLKRAVDAAEARLAELERDKHRLEARLADPALYEEPSDAVADLRRQHSDLERVLRQQEDAWLSAQAALEAAEENSAS